MIRYLSKSNVKIYNVNDILLLDPCIKTCLKSCVYRSMTPQHCEICGRQISTMMISQVFLGVSLLRTEVPSPSLQSYYLKFTGEVSRIPDV